MIFNCFHTPHLNGLHTPIIIILPVSCQTVILFWLPLRWPIVPLGGGRVPYSSRLENCLFFSWTSSMYASTLRNYPRHCAARSSCRWCAWPSVNPHSRRKWRTLYFAGLLGCSVAPDHDCWWVVWSRGGSYWGLAIAAISHSQPFPPGWVGLGSVYGLTALQRHFWAIRCVLNAPCTCSPWKWRNSSSACSRKSSCRCSFRSASVPKTLFPQR